MEQFIQLKKKDTLKIGIKDENGNDTGDFLEFDLEDIELPIRINESEYKHQKNMENFRIQLGALEKKEDKVGKKFLSWKEEQKIKLLKKYYKDEAEALDLFLGEGATKKLLNGRGYYLTMYDDIIEILEPIMPLFEQKEMDVIKRLKEKYNSNDDEIDVLE